MNRCEEDTAGLLVGLTDRQWAAVLTRRGRLFAWVRRLLSRS